MTLRVFFLGACFLLTSAYIAHASRSEAMVPARQPLEHLSLQIDRWQGEDAGEFKSKVVAILGVTDYLNRVYSSNGSQIGMYVGFHERQMGGNAIHSPMNCLPGAGLNPAQRGEVTIPVLSHSGSDTARDIVVNRVVIEKGSERQLAFYWYQSHGRVVADEYWGKMYTVLDSIRMNRTDAALVRILVPVRGDGTAAQASAEAEAISFVQALFPLLSNHLPE